MGLNEKRAIEAFKNGPFKDHAAAISAAAGFPVNLDVKWDTFASQLEGQGDIPAASKELFESVVFTPLQKAIAAICIDDMGKTALKGALKSVEVFCTGAHYSGNGVAFDGGVLKYDDSYSNTADVDSRVAAVKNALEAKL